MSPLMARNARTSRHATQRISREEYINRYKSIAISHQQRYGIPASITMAQGILESDCGNSHLAKGSNNHFGIKCKADWRGRTFTHTDDAPDECFRAYDSVEASYEDHAIFLDSSPRYDSLFLFAPTDYRSWARALKGAGYATAPDYAERLVQLIEVNKLYMLDGEAAQKGVLIASQQSTLTNYDEYQPAHGYLDIDPNTYRLAVNSQHGYNLYRTNKTLYILPKRGDTYTSLAKQFRLSPSALRKYNDVADRKAEPQPNDVIFLQRKQNQWGGNIDTHTVREGETLHSIAQSYGLRLTSLLRHNRVRKGETIKVGEVLILK